MIRGDRTAVRRQRTHSPVRKDREGSGGGACCGGRGALLEPGREPSDPWAGPWRVLWVE